MFWQKVHQFDQQVTLEINSWDSAFTDPIWEFFSDKYVWAPMYVAIIALLIWRLGWKKGLIAVAAALLTFGFCDQFSNVIKDAVGRLRPVNDEFMIASGLHVLERGGGFSFFSAHAANSFGLAVSTFMGIKEDKRLRYRGYAGWMFFWASMVSISRVFVGKHYLGDVLVGIIVGAAAGYAFGALARWIMKKISAKAA
jgi:undecaprenyl-diphosphatase